MKSKIYTCSCCGTEGELNVEFKSEAKKKKLDEDLMVCDECREELFQKKK